MAGRVLCVLLCILVGGCSFVEDQRSADAPARGPRSERLPFPGLPTTSSTSTSLPAADISGGSGATPVDGSTDTAPDGSEPVGPQPGAEGLEPNGSAPAGAAGPGGAPVPGSPTDRDKEVTAELIRQGITLCDLYIRTSVKSYEVFNSPEVLPASTYAERIAELAALADQITLLAPVEERPRTTAMSAGFAALAAGLRLATDEAGIRRAAVSYLRTFGAVTDQALSLAEDCPATIEQGAWIRHRPANWWMQLANRIEG